MTQEQPATPDGEEPVAPQGGKARKKLGTIIDPAFGHVSLTDVPRAEVVAQGFEKAIEQKLGGTYNGMDDGQKIYMRNWLFSISSYLSELVEERGRMEGQTPVRKMPKASSYIFSGEPESELYNQLLNQATKIDAAHALKADDQSEQAVRIRKEAELARADIDKNRGRFNPQDIIFTAHPNFSSTRELAGMTPELFKSFLKISVDDLLKMSKSPDEAAKVIAGAFDQNHQFSGQMQDALKAIRPRGYRDRAQELEEATIDLIPRTYRGNTEEVAVMMKRANKLGVKLPEQLSFEQTMALANLTSNHSTWFTDGDGKRTSHAWDNDFALPAIKVAAIDEYLQSLKGIQRQVAHRGELNEEVGKVIADLNKQKKLITQVRDAAKDRMLRLTELQTFAGELDAPDGETPRDEVTGGHQQIRDVAGAAHDKYRLMLFKQDGGETDHMKALKEDASHKVLDLARKLKQSNIRFDRFDSHLDGNRPEQADEDQRMSVLDALIIKASKGDFPVKIERRENANQHKVAIRYFINAFVSAGDDKLLVGMPIPGTNETLTSGQIDSAKRATKPAAEENLLKTVKVIADLASRARKGELHNDQERHAVERMKAVLLNTYRSVASDINNHTEVMPDEVPLELSKTASLFLDDVSPFFISGKLYPGAFKRVIIAEAGSPPNSMLSENNPGKTEREALLRSNNDILTANIFKNLMDSNVDVVPLYEDPSAIVNTPKMLGIQLKDPVYHDALGIDLKNPASRTMKDGKGEEITAYEFMRRQGFSDTDMLDRGMKSDEMKKAKVYVGTHKMLANSDSAKRGSLAAAILNMVSVIESYETAAKNMVTDANGQKYMYVNATYMGQGGSLARTTGTNALINTVTEQAEHASTTTGVYSAMKSVLRGITRLVTNSKEMDMDPEKPSGPMDLTRTAEGRKRIALASMSLGNPYGMRTNAAFLKDIKEAALMGAHKRIYNTRDDEVLRNDGSGEKWDKERDSAELRGKTRYETMLDRYGEALIPNYSARPAAKGAKDFVGTRAIGMAGQEFGFFSNIVGVSEMFQFDNNKRLTNLDTMAKIYQMDPSIKHNFDAAIYISAMSHKTLKHVWNKGGVTFHDDDQGNTYLTKGENTVKLSDLVRTYNNREVRYMNFDAADLAMANIHQQTKNFVIGMKQIKQAIDISSAGAKQYVNPYNGSDPITPPVDPIVLIPKHLRPTVEHARDLADNMMEYMHTVEAQNPDVLKKLKAWSKDKDIAPYDKPGNETARSYRMAKDSYYQLMETSLEQQALSHVPFMGAEEPQHALAM